MKLGEKEFSLSHGSHLPGEGKGCVMEVVGVKWMVWNPPACQHHLQPEPIDVTGTGGPCDKPNPSGGIHRKPRNLAHAREVMQIDWMSRRELSEAIPPAFTEWIGEQLIGALLDPPPRRAR